MSFLVLWIKMVFVVICAYAGIYALGKCDAFYEEDEVDCGTWMGFLSLLIFALTLALFVISIKAF